MSKSVEREEFEAFVSAPPFEYGLEIQPENGAWPGNYRSIAVQLAWEAWQARGAALSIQQEADAKDVDTDWTRGEVDSDGNKLVTVRHDYLVAAMGLLVDKKSDLAVTSDGLKNRRFLSE